jgi:hypothetical protein
MPRPRVAASWCPGVWTSGCRGTWTAGDLGVQALWTRATGVSGHLDVGRSPVSRRTQLRDRAARLVRCGVLPMASVSAVERSGGLIGNDTNIIGRRLLFLLEDEIPQRLIRELHRVAAESF